MSEAPSAVLDRPDQRLTIESRRVNLPTPLEEPGLPREAIAIPARKFDLPKTPAQFRQALGLQSEEAINAQADYEAAERKIRGEVNKATATIPHNQSHDSNAEVGLKYQDERLTTQKNDHSKLTRLWRWYMGKSLDRSGLKHGADILQAVEASVVISNRKNISPDAVVKLMRVLDPADEVAALRKFNLAIERAREFYMLPRDYAFNSDRAELIDMISVLGSIPEEEYRRIYHQFDGRTQLIFHDGNLCLGYGKPEQNGLLQIFKQHGLTPEQQEFLSQAAVWDYLTIALPLPSEMPTQDGYKEVNYKYWLDYQDLLNPHLAQQLGRYYPYLINWAISKGQTIKNYGQGFTEGIQMLHSTGQLARLDILIKAGWNCNSVYKAMEEAVRSDQSGNQLEQLKQELNQAIAFQLNSDKVAWAKAFKEFYFGESTLYTEEIPYLEKLVNSKEDLVTTALVLNSLPFKPADFQPGDFLSKEHAGINRRKLIAYLEQIDIPENAALADKKYFKGFIHLLSRNNPRYWELSESLPADELLFLLYLAVNKDRLAPTMFNDNGGITDGAAIINELSKGPVAATLMKTLISGCQDQDLLSPELKLAYFDSIRPMVKFRAFNSLPDELLMTHFRMDQASIVFFRQLDPMLKINLFNTGKEALGRFIKNGQPTADLIRWAIQTGIFHQVRPFITDQILATFSPESKQFFQACLNLSDEVVSIMSGKEGEWHSYFIDGKPTTSFLKLVAYTRNSTYINKLLAETDLNHLSLADQAFWTYYKSIPQNPAIRKYLLDAADQFSSLVVNGMPAVSFLQAAMSAKNFDLIREVLERIDWDKIPIEDKNIWQYLQQYRLGTMPTFLVDNLFSFILQNKGQFGQMVVDGQETAIFYQKLAVEVPQAMLEFSKFKSGLSAKQYQDLWRLAIGKEAIDRFLAVLPKSTDEARNAFTRNDYDRTSEFVSYLMDRIPAKEFKLTAAEFAVMTSYIAQFGLSRNEGMYKYYRNLYLFEHQQLTDLPEEMKSLGLTSTVEMTQRISDVRKMVFSERQLTNPSELRNLTPFQIQVLAAVTGYDSSRFERGSANDLARKIDQFAENLEQQRILPLPLGYQSEIIEASGIKVEFNAEAIKGDYEILRQEILECIDNPPTVDQLKAGVKSVIERRIGKINETLVRVPNEKAQVAMRRNITNFESYFAKLEQARDFDSLSLALLSMNFTSEDRSGGEGFMGIDSIFRRIILSKLYTRHSESPGFLENVRIKLSKDEVSAEGIDEIILTVDEMIKNHVLSLDQDNKENYWQQAVFTEIIHNDQLRKNFRRITERFNPHAEKLRQEQARFVRTQTGKISQVRIIPDRGLIGEMSGYLADVCYVRVPEMLKTYSGEEPADQMVIPYKFVEGYNSENPRFIGSVLVFEVQTAKGKSALLVRALDIPNESEINVGKFTESLFDKLVEVAKKQGRKKILVAGTGGTISNYSSITSYVLGKYVTGKESCSVSPEFSFNGYNITNQIYTAREVE